MSLVRVLRELSGDPSAPSFRLSSEDLALLPSSALTRAAALHRAELEARVPAALHARHDDESAALARDVHALLRRYNRSLHARVFGYLTLAKRSGFLYPWPVVAILGICQVLEGMGRNHTYGLVGRTLGALPFGLGMGLLTRISDRLEDVLRRTNRGIFADSAPTVLLGLRVHELRARGDEDLAEALLAVPPLLVVDEESAALARALASGLAVPNPLAQFRSLADLTLVHFAREQAIFTFQMGGGGAPREPRGVRERFFAKINAPAVVAAPEVLRSRAGRTLVFRDFALPKGFVMTDHDARVRAFSDAFVRPVTGDPADYRAAVDYVLARFEDER